VIESEQSTVLVEAVLFLENEPVDAAVIARITGLNRREVLDAVEKLRQLYARDDHGLEIVELGGGYTFSVKTQLWDRLKPHYGKRNEGKLSKAALETLSIVAYSQPVTRQEIESIRGVSADGMIKLLLSRNLIKEVGKKDAPGKPVQYGTTKDFLKTFRLASIADLPKMNELDEEKFEGGE
jgi:segregation and condensation protein B